MSELLILVNPYGILEVRFCLQKPILQEWATINREMSPECSMYSSAVAHPNWGGSRHTAAWCQLQKVVKYNCVTSLILVILEASKILNRLISGGCCY